MLNGPNQGAAAQFLSALDNINKSLTAPNLNPYFVFCLKPNDRRIANQFDSKCVRTQIQTFGIAEISQRLRHADFSLFLPFGASVTSLGSVTKARSIRMEGLASKPTWVATTPITFMVRLRQMMRRSPASLP